MELPPPTLRPHTVDAEPLLDGGDQVGRGRGLVAGVDRPQHVVELGPVGERGDEEPKVAELSCYNGAFSP